MPAQAPQSPPGWWTRETDLATPTTTIETIRNTLETSITALSPTTASGVPYRLTRGEEDDFRAWAEANPTSSLRRYSLYRSGSHEAGDRRILVTDEFRSALEMVVAYPEHYGAYEGAGLQNHQDLRDMIEEDANQIVRTIGRYGCGNWPVGAWPTGDAYEVEREEGVTFLTVRVPFSYYRAVSAAAAAAEATPTSIAELSAHSTPLQALADMMGFATAPDFLWIGDETSGTVTERGGSGNDLVNSGALLGQSSAALGSGNFAVLNDATDKMSITDKTALQPGSGSFAVCWIGTVDVFNSLKYIVQDRDPVSPNTGWAIGSWTGGSQFGVQFTLDFGGSSNTLVVPTTAMTVGEASVVIAMRDASAATTNLYTPGGDGQNTSVASSSVSNPSPEFGVGDAGPGTALQLTWGVVALWLGTAAENITATHHANLETQLGF